MSYAATSEVLLNPVDNMFGFVSRKKVQGAINEARKDFYASNVTGYRASQAELVEIAKEGSMLPRPEDRRTAPSETLTPRS